MADLKFDCPHCKQPLEAPPEYFGEIINCPSCNGEIHVPTASAPRRAVAPPLKFTPQKTTFNSRPPPINSVITGIPNPATPYRPLFLYIPTSRLIILSIVSMGVYEIYWIYKNWRYIKERDGLNISPFWRGWFGIFYCHSLLRRIHSDTEARAFIQPSFSPGGLATGWVLLLILSNIVGRAEEIIASIIAAFIPSFLCLAPVQNYINSVEEKRNPGQQYYKWSSGHIVCLVFGVIVWALLLIGLGTEI
ncbi:MAG TPA: hypothetical protein PKW49_11675 [Paludibacteraceae bacterium]|nr:hypothetical protein [Paludibacteraceae bacterium]